MTNAIGDQEFKHVQTRFKAKDAQELSSFNWEDPFLLSFRNVEDLLHERRIDFSHETVRFWWNRFGPMSEAEIRRNRICRMRSYSKWQRHLDEVFVKINGETHYLLLAVDRKCDVLESKVRKS